MRDASPEGTLQSRVVTPYQGYLAREHAPLSVRRLTPAVRDILPRQGRKYPLNFDTPVRLTQTDTNSTPIGRVSEQV